MEPQKKNNKKVILLLLAIATFCLLISGIITVVVILVNRDTDSRDEEQEEQETQSEDQFSLDAELEWGSNAFLFGYGFTKKVELNDDLVIASNKQDNPFITQCENYYSEVSIEDCNFITFDKDQTLLGTIEKTDLSQEEYIKDLEDFYSVNELEEEYKAFYNDVLVDVAVYEVQYMGEVEYAYCNSNVCIKLRDIEESELETILASINISDATESEQDAFIDLLLTNIESSAYTNSTIEISGTTFTLPQGYVGGDEVDLIDWRGPNDYCAEEDLEDKNEFCSVVEVQQSDNQYKRIIFSTPYQYRTLRSSDSCYVRETKTRNFGDAAAVTFIYEYMDSDKIEFDEDTGYSCDGTEKSSENFAFGHGCRNDGICIHSLGLTRDEFEQFLADLEE